jgi:hypothetical protein
MKIPVEHFSATPVYALSPALEQNFAQEPVFEKTTFFQTQHFWFN